MPLKIGFKVQKHITFHCLSVIFALLGSCTTTSDQDLQPPNIVWITSEDNSKHYMKLFDDNGVATPNIKALAETGLVFNKCFSNAPVCSVARSTLISGCYAPRVGAQYHRKLQKVPMPENVLMFPTYLRAAGYHTSNNSKEDYNFFKNDSVWDESSKTASWKNRNGRQPFFHVFNIGTTHESSLHFNKTQMTTNKTETNTDLFTVQPNHPDTELFNYTNARYRDNIVKMDRQVGEVVAELKEEGLLDNTFIFYFGDHGGVLPGSKGYLYETGLHVPLVVHIPNKYAHLVASEIGSTLETFVSFIDFAPTVLNLAGVAIPNAIDGKPFLGKSVKADNRVLRNETYSYADRFDEKYDMVRAVRKGKYKYIRNYQPFNFDGLMNNYRYKQLAYQEWAELYHKGKLSEIQAQFFKPRAPEQLFDVEADPYETQNLAQKADFADILKEMRQKLIDWTEEMPDLSFFPEHFLIKNAIENPVAFGQANKNNIQKYRTIADLSLTNFANAKAALRTSLQSEHPWERYWALIACSTFKDEANTFAPQAKKITQTDPEPINRVRAAEFLGIIKAESPVEVMTDALYSTKDGTEALLILNSIALLSDGDSKYIFQIDRNKISEEVKENEEVKRRLAYLAPL
ncbi:sulfatase [uncultured Kriegella sp.]|uniref:sulfatase n=1 Tax=uncultured Kriegella sp. TaxID=1798910 RepID=UPI0030D9B984|tara:strand:- start:333764 stop:335653 length:1890 start_codon:yes stop_codon:yes gene_type:complete